MRLMSKVYAIDMEGSVYNGRMEPRLVVIHKPQGDPAVLCEKGVIGNLPGRLWYNRILNFIFQSVPAGNDIVIYGSGYDFGLIQKQIISIGKRFKSSNLLGIAAACQSGVLRINGELTRMMIIPGKMMTLSQRDEKGKWRRHWRIYDLFSYFGCKFVDAVRQIASQEELEFLARMKEDRSNFGERDWGEIIEYTKLEVKLLARLGDKLRDLCTSQGISPRSWHGPAAIAKVYLKRCKPGKWSFKNGKIPKQIGEEVLDAIARAQYGGNVNAVQAGNFDRLYSYDITSAYPSAMRDLPLPKTWNPKKITVEQTQNIPTDKQMVLIHCKWELPHSHRGIMPFLFREPSEKCITPYIGEGWYWWQEFQAGRDLIERYGGRVEILEGYEWEETKTKPFFNFVDACFKKRLELKKTGDEAEIVMKLALNSAYGCLAQTVGKPQYYNPAYAGLITSHTRAKILRTAAGQERDVALIMTDGLYMTKPINKELPTGLGGWEYKGCKPGFIFRPGFMQWGDELKTLGIRKREELPAIFENLKKEYNIKGPATSTTINETRMTTVKIGEIIGVDPCSFREHEVKISMLTPKHNKYWTYIEWGLKKDKTNHYNIPISEGKGCSRPMPKKTITLPVMQADGSIRFKAISEKDLNSLNHVELETEENLEDAA